MSTLTPDPCRAPSDDEALTAQQMKQAEELLFSGPAAGGVRQGPVPGRVPRRRRLPLPRAARRRAGRGRRGRRRGPRVRRGADRRRRHRPRGRHPATVIDGLAELGVLGMTAPAEFGGRGFSQSAYCRIMEVIGGHCSSTAVFVNAHHSIGIRALLLFGTPEQKARWLPAAGRGEKLGGVRPDRDRGRLRRRQRPDHRHAHADGQTYVLNGTKRYITNGGIADVLTVMARTPDPDGRRVEDHGLPRHARHARLRGRRGADGQVRHPRHRHGEARLPRHARAGREHPRARSARG